MGSMLSYGTGICCHAFIYKKIIASFHSFFILVFKSGIDKSTERSTIPVCPSLTCFFNRGDTEGTNSSRTFSLMFVYVLFYVKLC